MRIVKIAALVLALLSGGAASGGDQVALSLRLETDCSTSAATWGTA